MKRGRGSQFDPDVLDAFFRLVDKGVIDPDKIYAQKHEEIRQAGQDAQDELARRVEEDKKIQAAQMKEDEENGNTDTTDSSSDEKGDEA
jgi:energy-coupling factor transport system substrate-specific component